MKELVTTVIPTYNGEVFIEDALASLAEQTVRPDRVVVMDDGSTDGTRELVETFPGLDCEWVANRNAGSLENHNRGLELAAETRFLHFLHQDDMVHPQFYEALLTANRLAGIDGRSLSYCVPCSGEEGCDAAWAPAWDRTFLRQTADRFVWERCKLGMINPSSVVLRTEWQPAPCRFGTEFPQVGDQVFMARWAAECSGVVRLPDGMCFYRRNPHGDTAGIVSRRLEAWVADELPAMRVMDGLLDGGRVRRWALMQALVALYFLRSVMKIKTKPECAARIAWEAGLALARFGRQRKVAR